MPRPVRKWVVKLRMWWADIRGHHGKRWDYEPSDYYMGRRKRNENKRKYGSVYADEKFN